MTDMRGWQAVREQQALAAMASHFDGAVWHTHRVGSALQDPRVLRHGHPEMWRQGVAATTLQVVQLRADPREHLVQRMIAASGGRLREVG